MLKEVFCTGKYDSYLLRIWRESKNVSWRFMVQNVRTGEQYGFRDADALFDFIEREYPKREIEIPADVQAVLSP